MKNLHLIATDKPSRLQLNVNTKNLILFDNKDIPDELKDIYWKEDGIVELKVDEEMIQETMDYLKNSIENIRNEKDFNAKIITEKNSFYCSFLFDYLHDLIFREM